MEYFKIYEKRGVYGLASIAFLVSGMLIYVFFRELDNMILFKWIPKPEFVKVLFIQLEPLFILNIIKYNFPYIFWFLSGILLMRFIWFNNLRIQKIYVFCFYICCFAYVLFKISNIFPGTFDWMDLLFMGIGAFLESILYKKLLIRRIK